MGGYTVTFERDAIECDPQYHGNTHDRFVPGPWRAITRAPNGFALRIDGDEAVNRLVLWLGKCRRPISAKRMHRALRKALGGKMGALAVARLESGAGGSCATIVSGR